MVLVEERTVGLMSKCVSRRPRVSLSREIEALRGSRVFVDARLHIGGRSENRDENLMGQTSGDKWKFMTTSRRFWLACNCNFFDEIGMY